MRDIEQMNQLIGNVLDLARGLEHEKPVRVDLVDFLYELAEDFSTPDCEILVNCQAGQFLLARSALSRYWKSAAERRSLCTWSAGGIELQRV